MRRVIHWAGWALIVVGVFALAWAITIWRWGDPITGAYTRWEQHSLSSEYKQIAERHRPPPRRPAQPPLTARDLRPAAVKMRSALEVGEPIGRIVVDRLGLDMVMVNGADTSSLRKGPGRHTETFLPAEGELVYIAGHRTTFAAPFAHIDRLRTGDRVVLEMPYGRFTYAVTSSVIVDADDIERLRTRGREEVALQACHPRFSASQRYIVYARPVGAPQAPAEP